MTSGATMTIAGRAVFGKSSIEVENPATGEVFAEVPDCTEEQLHEAMAAASDAVDGWSGREALRRRLLIELAEGLRRDADDLSLILVQEQGRPRAQAVVELQAAALWCERTAAFELPSEVLVDDSTRYIATRRRPLGVVGAITPWNYPVLLAIWKLAPALLAGNTIVLKPSPYTPLTTLLVGDLCRELFPPGVVNVVSGGDDLGRQIVRHPVPRKITFTGSVSAGRSVAAAAGNGIKRLTLELGGNDPAVLLPGTDIESIADRIVHAAFINSGQACNAIKRLYVHDADHGGVVDALRRRTEILRVGDGLDESSDLGPLINEAQVLRVSALVDNARANGGNVVVGGRRLGRRGFFYEPTIVTEVRAGSRLVEEEQFGPVLPIVRYSNLDQAIRDINAGPFGLCASVWSDDAEHATAVAQRLDCGTAWVNQHLAMGPEIPFGGAKLSGVGVENGLAGLLEYTQLQVLNVCRLTALDQQQKL